MFQGRYHINYIVFLIYIYIYIYLFNILYIYILYIYIYMICVCAYVYVFVPIALGFSQVQPLKNSSRPRPPNSARAWPPAASWSRCRRPAATVGDRPGSRLLGRCRTTSSATKNPAPGWSFLQSGRGRLKKGNSTQLWSATIGQQASVDECLQREWSGQLSLLDSRCCWVCRWLSVLWPKLLVTQSSNLGAKSAEASVETLKSRTAEHSGPPPRCEKRWQGVASFW